MIKNTNSSLSLKEFSELIDAYQVQMKPDNARFTSFDYCNNYFQQARKEGRTKLLTEGPQLELSVLQLGFYLASQGMYRGSTALLQHSSRVLIPVINVIAETPPAVGNPDGLFEEDDAAVFRLMGLYKKIEDALRFTPSQNAEKEGLLKVPTATLITKIMLGIWGNTPALDSYFYKGYGKHICIGNPEMAFRQVIKIWQELRRDYGSNTEIFGELNINTKHFTEGGHTFRYPKVKLLDMAYFQRGMGLSVKKNAAG